MCHHGGPPHPGLKGADLKSAMRLAKAQCEAAGEQFTPPRERVLHLLLASGGPLKAYDLIADYAKDGKAAHPPTVYRALEFLGRMGFVHRIESLNAYVPCQMEGVEHRAAFLICDCCGAAKEFEPDVHAELAVAGGEGYLLHSVTVEAHGLCAACRA